MNEEVVADLFTSFRRDLLVRRCLYMRELASSNLTYQMCRPVVPGDRISILEQATGGGKGLNTNVHIHECWIPTKINEEPVIVLCLNILVK